MPKDFFLLYFGDKIAYFNINSCNFVWETEIPLLK